MAAGAANRSAIAPRRTGDLTAAKAAWPDDERAAPATNAHDKRADDARAAVKGGESRRQAGEEGQRVDGEREQQPAQEANAENAENKSDDDHGGGLRDKGSNGRAFHHHHGALQSVAERDRGRQRKIWGISAATGPCLGVRASSPKRRSRTTAVPQIQRSFLAICD